MAVASALAVPLSGLGASALAATGGISTPAGVHVTSTTSSSVTLSWSPSTVSDSSGDAAAYYVLNGSNVVATSMGTSVTVSSLNPSTAYSFTVQAYDQAGSTSTASGAVSATTSASGTPGYYKTAYFAQWGIYGDQYDVANVDTTGVAGKVSSLIYAFENIDPTNLTCFETIKSSDSSNESDPNAGDGAGDAYADYQDTNVGSVDGSSTAWSQPLKGNFNQLRELKVKYPNLKVLLSIGGWTYSKYFSDVAATAASRQKFVSSCLDMFIKGNLPTGIGGDTSGGPASAAGIFDGIDIDWEYPGVVGHLGNHVSASDKANYTLLLQEFRTELDAYGASIGKHYLLTAAVGAGQDKLAQVETNKIGNYLDYADAMTYDMHGGFETNGPTNFQDPLYQSPADPSTNIAPGNEKYSIDTTVKAFTTGLSDYGIPGGFPASKLVMGFPLYYRGWTGVPAGPNHGLYQSATGPSAAQSKSATAGTAFYSEIASEVQNDSFYDSTSMASWVYDGTNFYTGDTPTSIAAKDNYIKNKGLAGAMMWSLEDEDTGTTLLNAVVSGLAGGSGSTGTPTPTPTTTSPTPTPTTTSPTPTPTTTSPTPTPTTTSPTPTSGCTAPAYSNTAVYTQGMQVSYNGHTWTAKWWTQGEAPSTGGSGVWTDNGPCAGGTTSTPTPTTTSATPTPTTTSPTPTPTTTSPTPTPTATTSAPAGALTDGGFENGLSPWTCQSGSGVVSSPVRSGSHALAVAATSSQTGECDQAVHLTANHSYTLTAWVQGQYAYLGLTGGSSTWTSSSGWTQLSVPFTTDSTGNATVYVHGWYGQGTVDVDDVSIS